MHSIDGRQTVVDYRWGAISLETPLDVSQKSKAQLNILIGILLKKNIYICITLCHVTMEKNLLDHPWLIIDGAPSLWKPP